MPETMSPPPISPPPPPAQAPNPKSGHKLLYGFLACGSLFVLVIIAGALATPKKTVTTTAANAPAVTSAPVVVAPSTEAATTTPPTTEAPITTPPTTAAPPETPGQSNARRSAAQYLNTMPFSRLGLIKQLESSYGAGFAHDDAVYGVNAQNANWNAEAVKAAKQYLNTMPMSRAALIKQLESAYGSQFTHDEAVYGANGAGV